MTSALEQKNGLLYAESPTRLVIHLGHMQGLALAHDLAECHNHLFHRAIGPDGAVMVILENTRLEGIVPRHSTVLLTTQLQRKNWSV